MEHLPKQGLDARGNLVFLAKMAGLAIVLFVPLLLIPGVMPKVGITGLFVGLYLWFIVFRHAGDSQMRIEEVNNGVKKQINA